MYSVLIMGGSDFVGSSLAKYLIKKKYDVDIMTRGIRSIDYDGIGKHLICNRKNADEMKMILKDKKYDYVYDISIKNNWRYKWNCNFSKYSTTCCLINFSCLVVLRIN